MGEICIRRLQSGDWPQIQRLLETFILQGRSTLDAQVPEWNDWNEKYHPRLRFGAWEDACLVGFAAAYPTSTRKVYAGVGEVSIYVDSDRHRRGIGSALLDSLIRGSEAEQFWTLQALVFPDNRASVSLLQRAGFRLVGCRKKLGRRADGVWQDLMLWERRSDNIW